MNGTKVSFENMLQSNEQRITLTRFRAILLCFILIQTPLNSQEKSNTSLILQGPTPTGVRSSVTENWGALDFTVINPSDTAREARVAVYYPEKPDVQYARDIWVPARSSVTTWLNIGPAPKQRAEHSREFQMVLFDRTGGKSQVVLPSSEERTRSRGVLYRKREQTTTLMTESEIADPNNPTLFISPELMTLARLPRDGSLSEHISIVADGPIPQSAEAFDGIDVFILASNRLAKDPPGCAAIRRWVEQGGRLWVMLDRVDLDVVAPILGDDFNIGIIDRIGLTTVQLKSNSDSATVEPSRDFEQPVPFVRTIISNDDRVFATVDGWPAMFSRRLGRGKVLFTNLGPAAWSKPRGKRDGRSHFQGLPDFPVPADAVKFLSLELHPPPEVDVLPPDFFKPIIAEEIGYSIIGRNTVSLMLTGFVSMLLAIAIASRRIRRPEIIAGLIVFAVVGTSLIFIFLGERSRRAVPATIALEATVEVIPGSHEAVVSGLYASFQPESGSVDLGSDVGAILGLDAEGLEGKTRSRVDVDTDRWHWEGVAFPAGTRTGTFRLTMKTEPVSAKVKFGPTGLEGQLSVGPFKNVGDAIIAPQAKEPLAVDLSTSNQFVTNSNDFLPFNQYLAGTVLSDTQQRRQTIYRQLYSGPTPRHLEGRDLLWFWADANEPPLRHSENTRVIGNLLISIPLEFERTLPNTAVKIPRGMIPYKRLSENGKQLPLTTSAQYPANMRLRFQIPKSVVPLRLERATFYLQAKIPSRKLTVSALSDGKPVVIYEKDAPNELIRIDILDVNQLKLDSEGGFYLNVAIGKNPAETSEDTGWKIESLSLEVTGRTE